jgi:hypothetical protein
MSILLKDDDVKTLRQAIRAWNTSGKHEERLKTIDDFGTDEGSVGLLYLTFSILDCAIGEQQT